MADMREGKFNEEQIIGFLKQAEAGMPEAEICRKGGFSDATSTSGARSSAAWKRRTRSETT
jgi:hypothetical protein